MKPGASTPARQDAAFAHITPFAALACPLDGAPLQRHAAAWRCAAGHSFDIASQGYTHLLPVQNKNSLNPGDDADMVLARRSFLEAGYYAPFRETLKGVITPLHAGVLLDSGCGEGWY